MRRMPDRNTEYTRFAGPRRAVSNLALCPPRHVITAARRLWLGKIDLNIEGASIQAEQVLVIGLVLSRSHLKCS